MDRRARIYGVLRNLAQISGTSTELIVTGEKMLIEPGSLAWQSDTLPRRYKSRLVPQGSTSVYYT